MATEKQIDKALEILRTITELLTSERNLVGIEERKKSRFLSGRNKGIEEKL